MVSLDVLMTLRSMKIALSHPLFFRNPYCVCSIVLLYVYNILFNTIIGSRREIVAETLIPRYFVASDLEPFLENATHFRFQPN